MANQEKLYQEFQQEYQTSETIGDLRKETESNSIPLNFGKFIRVFPISQTYIEERGNDIELHIESRNTLVRDLEEKLQFRPESIEKTNLNKIRIFIPENNDFFFTGYGKPTGPGSLFFSTTLIDGEEDTLRKIEAFNQKARSEKQENLLIDISPKTLGKKIQKFLQDMAEYYTSKVKNQDWKSLEEKFIPTYKYIPETGKKGDSLGKERLIILLISQEKELFEKAQVLTNALPKTVKIHITFDFKSLLEKYDFLLENLSKAAPQKTETQKIQALSIFSKKQEYDKGLAKIFDKLYEGGKSSEEALEKAKSDWFLSFFLNHPDKTLAKIWEKKIKNWQIKRNLKIYYDGTHRDDTKIFISTLQYQIFGREEKEYIDGKVGNIFFERFAQVSED